MATERSDDRIAQFEAEIERLTRLNEDKFRHMQGYCKAADADRAEIDRLRAAVAGLAGACRSALERHRYPVADGRGGARPMHCGCDTCRGLRTALDAHADDAVPTTEPDRSDRP